MSNEDELTTAEKNSILGSLDVRNIKDFDEELLDWLFGNDTKGQDMADIDPRKRRAFLIYGAGIHTIIKKHNELSSNSPETNTSLAWVAGFFSGYRYANSGGTLEKKV